jgi:tRNA (adenine22-N1)-methyltransferase
MPRLDLRLKTVARQIRSSVHVDIGSDHGHLLLALLKAGRIDRGIAVENKLLPLENSRRTLASMPVDVRYGDGLDAVSDGEADSLSICGLGGTRIVRILARHPGRVPDRVVLQPNKRCDLVRRWGLMQGFHLVDEQVTPDHGQFVILSFQRDASRPDPAYQGLERESALMLGPWILRRRERSTCLLLQQHRRYLLELPRLDAKASWQLAVIDRILANW